MVAPSDLELYCSLIRNLRKPGLVAALVGYPNALGGINLTVQVRKENLLEARAKESADEERLNSGVLISTMAVAQLKTLFILLTWMAAHCE